MPAKTIILTGTHLTPALALTERLIKSEWQVVYLGRNRSMAGSSKEAAEKQLLSGTRVRFYSLITSRLPWGIMKLPFATIQAINYLRRFKPQVVVSFGGHIALPVVLGAKLLGIPVVIHEQTFGAGFTNRLTAPLATAVALSWPESLPFFPAKKTVITGNPLRRTILSAKGKSVKTAKPTLYITGGNQGSLTINETISQILPQLLRRFIVYHQFGLTQTDASWKKLVRREKNYHLKRWFDDEYLTKILATKPLVVCRSGANTVTELAYLNLPAVVIPLPIAQNQEQLVNANYLVKRGLAIILPQDKLSGPSLLSAIKTAKATLPKKAPGSAPPRPDAVEKLYQLITKVINRA